MPKHTVDEHLDHLRRFIVVLKEHHRELAELRKEKRKRRDALKANVDALAARLIELRRMQDKADKSAPKTLGDFLRVRPPDARLNALYRMFIDLLPAMIRFYDEEVTPKFATFRKTAEAWKAAIATIQEDWRGCEPKDANRWEGLYKAYKALQGEHDDFFDYVARKKAGPTFDETKMLQRLKDRTEPKFVELDLGVTDSEL